MKIKVLIVYLLYFGVTKSQNLVVNGNFSAGNTNFVTTDIYCNTSGCLLPFVNNAYAIGPNPNYFHFLFFGSDHTTGSGNMMIVNGGLLADVVWTQNVNVNANTTYSFTTWVSSIYQLNTATIGFSINSIGLGSVAAPLALNTWTPFTTIWNSGAATSASIEIRCLNTSIAASQSGVDFGIDDIILSLVTPTAAFITNTLSACAGSAFTFTNNSTWASSYIWDFGDGTPVSTQTNTSHTYTNAGTYIVQLTASNGTISALSSTTITVGPGPQLLITPTLSAICAGQSITLMVGGANTYTWDNGVTTNSLVVTPVNNLVISVIGSALGCTASASANVDVYLTPTVTMQLPVVCSGQSIALTANAPQAFIYQWTGPNSFTSVTQSPSFAIASPSLNGTYNLTITSVQGCTNSANLNLQIISVPVPTLSMNASTLCSGSNLNLTGSGAPSYTWSGPNSFSSFFSNTSINNISVFASGVYTLLASNGSCTASVSTSLTVYPSPTVSALSVSVCSGQTVSLMSSTSPGLTYQWSGPNAFTSAVQNPSFAVANITMNGSYNLIVSNAQSCTNSATSVLQVIAMPNPLIAVNASTLCSGSDLTLFGSGGNNYSWSGPNAFTNTQQNVIINNVSVFAVGVYTLMAANGSCTASTTQSVVVLPSPTPSVSYLPACETRSFQLNGSAEAGCTYLWLGPNAFSSNLQDPLFINSNLSLAGIYTLVVTQSNSCQSFTFLPVTVFPNPTLIVNDATVCIGNSATLEVNGAVNYVWIGPDGFSTNTSGNLLLTAQSNLPETYTVIGFSANSCTSSAMMKLSTNPLPNAFSNVLPSVCLNSTIALVGGGTGSSYEWTGPNNFFSSSQNAMLLASNFGFAGNYTLTVKSEFGCASKTITLINVDDIPTGELISEGKTNCIPFCSEFRFKNATATNILTANWQINDQLLTAESFPYCVNKPGNHLVIGSFTNAAGCTNRIQFNIPAHLKPEADFNYWPQKAVAEVDDVNFMNASKGDELISWNWYFISNTNYQSSDENTSYMFNNEGIFPVALVVKNKWGCADTVVKAIHVEKDFNLYVPNAFTPNHDGDNDLFFPKGTGIVKYNLVVYDRWGEKLFTTSNFSEAWDGGYKGQSCKTDVYIWKINVTDANGKMRELTGNVLLYR